MQSFAVYVHSLQHSHPRTMQDVAFARMDATITSEDRMDLTEETTAESQNLPNEKMKCGCQKNGAPD
jgi:hypothetical protein